MSVMFGGRKKRVEKLSAGAMANLEDGESIRELVQTQTGQSAAANASAVATSGLVSSELGIFYRSEVSAGPHVLVATERNLYAMKLSGGRLLDVGDVVLKAPLDKAELYSTGQIPRELPQDRARELASHIKDLWHESDTYPIYEGRVGASPREMQGVLLAAAGAGASRYDYVSPLAVLDEIVDLCKQTSLYEFLRQDVQPGGYHDHKKLVDVARGRLFDRIDEEVRAAVGLVEESEYGRVFDRYITHVMHAIKKEKVRNPQTGRTDDPDEGMMKEVERTLEITGRPDDFRQSLIAKIGAWSLDHRGQKPVMSEIFAELLRKLRDAYFERHKKTIARGIGDLVKVLSGNEASLSAEARTRTDSALQTLIDKYGYSRESARDLVGALATLRYRT